MLSMRCGFTNASSWQHDSHDYAGVVKRSSLNGPNGSKKSRLHLNELAHVHANAVPDAIGNGYHLVNHAPIKSRCQRYRRKTVDASAHRSISAMLLAAGEEPLIR
jgi:hypothetical protein